MMVKGFPGLSGKALETLREDSLFSGLLLRRNAYHRHFSGYRESISPGGKIVREYVGEWVSSGLTRRGEILARVIYTVSAGAAFVLFCMSATAPLPFNTGKIAALFQFVSFSCLCLTSIAALRRLFAPFKMTQRQYGQTGVSLQRGLFAAGGCLGLYGGYAGVLCHLSASSSAFCTAGLFSAALLSGAAGMLEKSLPYRRTASGNEIRDEDILL